MNKSRRTMKAVSYSYDQFLYNCKVSFLWWANFSLFSFVHLYKSMCIYMGKSALKQIICYKVNLGLDLDGLDGFLVWVPNQKIMLTLLCSSFHNRLKIVFLISYRYTSRNFSLLPAQLMLEDKLSALCCFSATKDICDDIYTKNRLT